MTWRLNPTQTLIQISTFTPLTWDTHMSDISRVISQNRADETRNHVLTGAIEFVVVVSLVAVSIASSWVISVL